MKLYLKYFSTPRSAFTLIEIAISLAIIGIALLAIIGVLPFGMNAQKDNREITVVNQDATVFIEAIRNGARGLDDLTNYVYAITNYWTLYNANSTVNTLGVDGYSYQGSQITKVGPVPLFRINNGFRIIGLLSTPEFTDVNFNPTNNLFSGGYSNHVVAYVRSLSGPAVEKPPQDNGLLRDASFGYRIFCVNAPVATDTNALNSPYNKQIAANLHELRLTFLWPTLPNGNVGSSRQTFRTLIGGEITQTNDLNLGQRLYFYQSQSFTNVP